MIEVEDVINWLKDGEDFDAAILIEQCDFSYEFKDLAFPLKETNIKRIIKPE